MTHKRSVKESLRVVQGHCNRVIRSDEETLPTPGTTTVRIYSISL